MKLLGAAAVLGASVALGARRSAARWRELKCLDGLCHAVRLMRAELVSRLSPMEELLRFAASRTAGETADFLTSVLQNMDRLGERSFAELWSDAAEGCLSSLPAAQRLALHRLGAALGRFELQEQEAACEAFLLEAQAALDERRAAFPQRRRLDFALGAAGGALLCLVLF